MDKTMFSIAQNFSRYPGPRYKWQGPHSGETLRTKLAALLRASKNRIVVSLDGTTGIGSSFLDEAFGGLISKEGFAKDEVSGRFDFVSEVDPSYIYTIRDSIERADPAAA